MFHTVTCLHSLPLPSALTAVLMRHSGKCLCPASSLPVFLCPLLLSPVSLPQVIALCVACSGTDEFQQRCDCIVPSVRPPATHVVPSARPPAPCIVPSARPPAPHMLFWCSLQPPLPPPASFKSPQVWPMGSDYCLPSLQPSLGLSSVPHPACPWKHCLCTVPWTSVWTHPVNGSQHVTSE